MQTALFDGFRQPLQSIRQLCPVYLPISERRAVAVSPAEPAVIQHKELGTQFGGHFTEFRQVLLVEIEIGGFPVVEQDRALPLPEFRRENMLTNEAVKFFAHTVQPFIRVDHDRLGCVKTFSRRQLPFEGVGVNTQVYSQIVVMIQFQLGQEVAAVNE